MAYLVTENGTRTELKPAGNHFTEAELKVHLSALALDIFELPGDLYAVTIHHAREIGASRNDVAAGYQVHLAHLEVDGKLPLDETRNPPPQFYGPAIFCRGAELNGTDQPAYTGKGDAPDAEAEGV